MRKLFAVGAMLVCAFYAVALAEANAGSLVSRTIPRGAKLHPGLVIHAPVKVKGHRVRRYQWERCNARGRQCSTIRGATHRAYRLTRRDVGHTLVVRMAVGSTIVTSSPTGVVGAPAPVNTQVPVISDTTSGNAQDVTVGDALTGTLGSWTGAVDYSWAWQHCPAAGACSTVASGGPTSDASTAPAYTVQAADKGDTLVLVVTAFSTPQ